MQEKKKKQVEQPSPSPGFGSFGFDDGASDPLSVNVGSGGYNENLPVAGMTVGEIRKKFKVRMEIADESVGVVNGKDADENYTTKAGEKVQFIHKAGEKGSASLIGRRVRVMDGMNEQVLGEGQYVGDVTTYVARMPDGSIHSYPNAEEKPTSGQWHEIPNNPKIVLDSGEVVYGCQVWWEPI